METNRILTKEIQISLDDKKSRGNDHIFITAPKQEDVTMHYLLPNILQGNTNYVIADRGGNIYQKTEKYLREQEYGIQVLNFANPAHSLHFNPFHSVVDGERLIRGYSKGYQVAFEGPGVQHEPQRVVVQVEDRKIRGDGGEKSIVSMVNTFLRTTEHWSSGGDAGFKICEKFLLQALALCVAETYEKKERSFWKIIELLQAFSSGKLGTLMSGLQQKNSTSKAVKNYSLFEMSARADAAHIVESLYRRLQVFENDVVKELMCDSTLDFEALAKEKQVLFIIMPEEDELFQFAVPMLIEQVDETLRAYTERECAGYRLPVPVTIAASLEYANFISDIAFRIGTSRKYNIGYNIISNEEAFDWQDLDYECDNRLIFGNGNECIWIARGSEPFVGTKYEPSEHPKYKK